MKRYQAVPFQQVDLDQGFWQDRQRINSDVTIWNVYKRFQETGRFDALSCDWREGMPNKPHVYWDSDVAKWMEAAAFILERKPDPQLEAAVEMCIRDSPHLLHVETAQPAVCAEETGEAEAAPQSVGELFAAFYADMTGRPLNGEQREIVSKTLKNLEVEP